MITVGYKRLPPLALLFALALVSGCSSSSNSNPSNDAPPSGTDTGNVPDDATPDTDNDTGDNPDTTTGGEPDTDNTDTPTVVVSPEITPDRVLEPLPSQPLTPAPGADSEPVRSTGPVTTVSEFFVVRNPDRDLDDDFGVLTDADFEAGPLPAVTYIPDDVDTSTNSLPYFENLNDVEVFAGEELNLVLRPLDADGGIPGLFPYAIPPGARYVDNLNGTRSLIWQPLQPDVGIREFTITATDPVEPYYRTERTVRIRVKMPSDPQSIVNRSPSINEIKPHTLRVNDPVTLYIKVTDPNGTIPTLEIANPPAGATIVPHYSEPDFTILRFTPRTAETLVLELTAIDSDDASLTYSRTVTLEVLEEDDFIRPGSRLRDLAASRDLLFGYAALQGFYERPDGALYADIAAEEFNFVTTENSLKWDLLNPLPGKYRWAQADNLIQLAKVSRQAVHGHTLVWYTQLPGWIKRSELADRETHMREFIDRVLTRYADDVPIWDVVNEALEADGTLRHSTWYEAMGGDFIDIAFRQARLSAPDATLLYNDYDVSFAGPKSDGLIALMTSLKDAGTPVDGVGFQMHLDADFDRFDEVAATFQKMADLDLDIYITELDVSIRNGMTEAQQAVVYEEVLSLCLEQARCKAYQIWGFTDMYSWRDEFNPLIFDRRYQTKPAYAALQRRLSEN
ncbi:endo-1,4-beta-xylanase [Granulosicoccus antarcticus]|uniref:endo-1,4-beta-xylanase n=1 Tax=Granulosicoccus antarcticus TaxID=437505 RepID=UPI0012FDDDFF|nr:endo-1,4-beta-xylanase [Granulosicoccus antarcticus]